MRMTLVGEEERVRRSRESSLRREQGSTREGKVSGTHVLDLVDGKVGISRDARVASAAGWTDVDDDHHLRAIGEAGSGPEGQRSRASQRAMRQT